jgi:hypothetical protein
MLNLIPFFSVVTCACTIPRFVYFYVFNLISICFISFYTRIRCLLDYLLSLHGFILSFSSLQVHPCHTNPLLSLIQTPAP